MNKFQKRRSHAIPTLNAIVEEYEDPASGARHYHLATDQSELTFLVAFPTCPDTSDGRAHILEHLSLCGSQRFPVRDPFFAMMRRSTATFMNAFTYPDRTVYPFASTDRIDFFNLLDVYLDATFFPRLDYLNFLQEGWRYTLEDGKLGYQGVVFNEMKGVYTDPVRALHAEIAAAQLRDTTYANDSGGDPLVIPQLTHQMLLDFHASHYHPSQAIFMTSGAVSPQEVQQRICDHVLSKLPGKMPNVLPALAIPAAQARQNTIRVPSHSDEADNYGLQLTWLLGPAADTASYFNAMILTAGLLGSSAAPVQKVLESSGFGRPSMLNGFDPGARQMLFYIGMEGLTSDQIDDAHQRIWTALEHTAEHGVPQSLLNAALRDLKYQQRDTSRGRLPNVLNRMLQALPIAMHGGDMFTAIDSSAALDRLEHDIADPAFFKGLVRQLLDSPTLLTSRIEPDTGYFIKRDTTEAEVLAAARSSLTERDLHRIAHDTDALLAHQEQASNFSVLPRIKPQDVSPQPVDLPAIPAQLEGKYVFPIASNGISYTSVEFNVSALPKETWPWLVLYSELRGALGVGERNFEEAASWRETRVASLGFSLDASLASDSSLLLNFNLRCSGLSEEQVGIGQVLAVYLGQPRFDEKERIAFLIERLYQNHVSNLAQDGDRYSAIAARVALSSIGDFDDRTSGIGFLQFVGALERSARTADGLALICHKMESMHQFIVNSPAVVLCAGADAQVQQLALQMALPINLEQPVAASPAQKPSARQPQPQPANEALYAASQINHCNVAWKTATMFSDQGPALAVAAELMSQQLLHQSLREKGGAYGGAAKYDGEAGVFSMSSYRDPRLAATYADFAQAVVDVLNNDFSAEQVEEAIIGVIKKLDQPKAPFDEVLAAWRQHRRGLSNAERQRFRSGVLRCDADAIRTAVRENLQQQGASRAAFIGSTEQDMTGLRLSELHAFVKAVRA